MSDDFSAWRFLKFQEGRVGWHCKDIPLSRQKVYLFSIPFRPDTTLHGASLVAQMVKNLPAVQKTGFDPWIGKSPWRWERLPSPVFLPGEFHEQRATVHGIAESDTTELLTLHFHHPLSVSHHKLQLEVFVVSWFHERCGFVDLYSSLCLGVPFLRM